MALVGETDGDLLASMTVVVTAFTSEFLIY
jgi:hypothetical protein